MSDSAAPATGPDLGAGIPADRIKDQEMVLGHVAGTPVLLVRRGANFHAVAATCTHYSGPLAEGLVVGDTIRCPLHHACFDLRTGEVLRAPALAPLARYEVIRQQELLLVRGPVEKPLPPKAASPARGKGPSRIVIVGAGAAGGAAALTLRQEGFTGEIALIGEEPDAPYDRPNLSKDYLAGSASEEWLPLTPRSTYDEQSIRLILGTPVVRIDSAGRTVALADGQKFPYDALLLAVGARAFRPPIPGIDRAHVHHLRTLADCRAIITKAGSATSAAVIGTSFMGMEIAAALRQRGLSVHMAGPDQRPLEKVLGEELGRYLQRLHESHGVVFHLGRAVAEIGEHEVRLDDGSTLAAELVIVATGVQPDTSLAAQAGLAIDRGILVDRYLKTSVEGIYAAGDVARWPDPRSGEPTRFEHWVTAERQGQTAARNMLGRQEPFEAVPFFWTQHYDVRVNYVGRATSWERLEVKTGLPADSWEQRYYVAGDLAAVASIGRDQESLAAELALEQKAHPAKGAG